MSAKSSNFYKLARFVTTAMKAEHYPLLRDCHGKEIPEIAVVGRSNVGKSSLLNTLFHQQGLVKTSATPGKTQAINFFACGEELVFADLPGYGYAVVPEEVRRKWAPMIETYLQKREPLKLILLLLDIRRKPSPEDQQFFEWLVYYQKKVILVFTKVDKVKTAERNQQTKEIFKALGVIKAPFVYFSATKPLGIEELKKKIGAILGECADEDG